MKSLKLWIARDKDGSLCLHLAKPFCSTSGTWYSPTQTVFLDENFYPEITFENSPQQVELKLIEENESN